MRLLKWFSFFAVQTLGFSTSQLKSRIRFSLESTEIFSKNTMLDEADDVVRKALSVFCLSAAISISPAVAVDYGSMSQEQQMVAEAWRLVDR